ncbi:uncharacterized protein UV8b_05869 [Ustilaginoidea virens]|uniref:Uncharacterized protein n=1 Tax=Ustilaginoidea virens TaxID=1159556 RepID=A0A8E5HU82_USTVR|nr:uncharacterized protein UV8b_05869 [Ustilaginoidea virens]QUC21626.1 hypothetical protein UV8b_05869 [Ustilaginoidea virens]
MAYPPPRRSRYDEDDGYYGAAADDRYTAPPPRRHKSERHHRYRSPEIPPPQETYAPRRGRSRREALEPLGKSLGGGSRRLRSPSPYETAEPVPRESRTHGRREPHYSRPERDGPRDPYSLEHEHDPRDRHRRPHRDDFEHRPRRDRASPSPDYSRRHARDGGGHRSYKSRAASPEPRPRGREHLGQAYGADHGKHRPRSRSHDRAAKRGGSPPRGRDGGQGPSSSKPSSSRRKSAPAPPVAAGPKVKKQQWWQNPLIQAGARTAFSAGAQAAMQSRKDPSPWLGSKGAKVATAALGAALMDSFGSGGKK